MTITYPFYGRLFDIFLRWRIRPWFKGADEMARYATAVGLITFHQFLGLIAALTGYARWAGYRMSLNEAVFVCSFLALHGFNLFIFRKRSKPERTRAPVDTAYVLAYAVTFTVFALVISVSAPKP